MNNVTCPRGFKFPLWHYRELNHNPMLETTRGNRNIMFLICLRSKPSDVGYLKFAYSPFYHVIYHSHEVHNP